MKRIRAFLFLSGLALVAAAGVAGCGDGGATCGTGTHEEGGVCIADPVTPTECGTGTVLMAGECVPDGSVVCQQGTVFDAPTGTCVIDPTACTDGTTLVDGECIPDDELLMGAADHVEAAEPNDPGSAGSAGSFAVPALDASTTFYGCVTATTDADMDGNLDADLDTWLVNATGPTVLEITTDGLRGLSAGFFVVSADAAHPATLDNFQRIGINLTSDTAKREVYLPAAGRYAIIVTDGRSLFLGQAGAGTPDTCYFATVKHVATPAPVALTVPQTTGTDNGKVKLYTFTANANGDLIDATLTAGGPALSPAFISLRGAAIHKSAVADASGNPPSDTIGGLDNAEVVTLVVDAEYNYGAVPQAFTIDTTSIDAQPLSTSGGMITVTNANDGVAPLTFAELNYQYFDVATAGLKRFVVTPSVATDMVIVRRDVFTPAGGLDVVAQIDAFGPPGRAAFDNEFVKFLTPGRYYFLTVNPAATAAGGTYTITSTIGDQPTAPIALGTAATNQTLTNGNSFLTLDLTNPVWIEAGITATADFGTGNTAGVEAYDLASEGWLRTGAVPGTIPAGNIYPAFNSTQPTVAPFAPFGRIVAGDTRDFLVRTRPTGAGAVGPAPSYSMLIQNRPNVVNLGMQAPGAPTMQTATGLTDTSAPARYIVLGTAGNNLTVLAHPVNALADVRIRRLNVSEGVVTTVDAATPGTDETLRTSFVAAPGNWVAWAVDDKTVGQPTDVTQTVTVSTPRPYTVTTGALAWNDACTGGTTIGANRDDEIATAQTLPAAFATFQLFGDTLPATHRVGSNGWMSWDTGTVSFGAYQNRTMPLAGPPDGVIAPFWQDLDTVTLCRKDDLTAGAETVTYQWTGRVYQSAGQNVQFQVVLHANGVIDFIYGPMHVSNGAFADSDTNGATVGAENLSGTFGHQVHYNTASVTASSSRTLTPM